jgi:hypothetical protein
MPKGLKAKPIKESTRFKTVKETTRVYEHKCTPKCFHHIRRPTPPGLRRVSLGYIYMSSDGRFYMKWGKDDWLPVEGVDFGRRMDGTLVKWFRPTVQLHIHSPGGRTIAKAVTRKDIRPGEEYHAREAAKKLKRKGRKLKEAQNFLGAEVAKVISHAPKKRTPQKGTGRGAAGMPRSEFSKEVVSLRESGMSEGEAVEKMIIWLRERGQPATPLHRTGIRKRVHRWFVPATKKPGHK